MTTFDTKPDASINAQQLIQIMIHRWIIHNSEQLHHLAYGNSTRIRQAIENALALVREFESEVARNRAVFIGDVSAKKYDDIEESLAKIEKGLKRKLDDKFYVIRAWFGVSEEGVFKDHCDKVTAALKEVQLTLEKGGKFKRGVDGLIRTFKGGVEVVKPISRIFFGSSEKKAKNKSEKPVKTADEEPE